MLLSTNSPRGLFTGLNFEASNQCCSGNRNRVTADSYGSNKPGRKPAGQRLVPNITDADKSHDDFAMIMHSSPQSQPSENTSDYSFESPESSSVMNNVLFVGDLARFCTEWELATAVVHSIGPVHGKDALIKVAIKRSLGGVSLGYGFIFMRDYASARLVLQNLDRKILCGRPIHVHWAQGTARGKTESSSRESEHSMTSTTSSETVSVIDSITKGNDNTSNSIFVRFRSFKIWEVVVTESLLLSVFRSYGIVLDVTVRLSYFDRMTGEQVGFGFILLPNTAEGLQLSRNILRDHAVIDTDEARFQCEPSRQLAQLFTHVTDATEEQIERTINNNDSSITTEGSTHELHDLKSSKVTSNTCPPDQDVADPRRSQTRSRSSRPQTRIQKLQRYKCQHSADHSTLYDHNQRPPAFYHYSYGYPTPLVVDPFSASQISSPFQIYLCSYPHPYPYPCTTYWCPGSQESLEAPLPNYSSYPSYGPSY